MKTEYDFSKARRGAVVPETPGKTRITIRIDDEILEWFKAKANSMGGGNYQTMINAALKQHIEGDDKRLEEMLRRIIREEVRH